MAIYAPVKLFVEHGMRRVRLESRAQMRHRGDSGRKITVKAEPDRARNSRAESGRLECMGTRRRQIEDISGRPHRGVRLRASAGDAQAGDRDLALRPNAFAALAQRVGKPFEDRAIQMSARMSISKADDGAASVRTRHGNAR